MNSLEKKKPRRAHGAALDQGEMRARGGHGSSGAYAKRSQKHINNFGAGGTRSRTDLGGKSGEWALAFGERCPLQVEVLGESNQKRTKEHMINPG